MSIYGAAASMSDSYNNDKKVLNRFRKSKYNTILSKRNLINEFRKGMCDLQRKWGEAGKENKKYWYYWYSQWRIFKEEYLYPYNKDIILVYLGSRDRGNQIHCSFEDRTILTIFGDSLGEDIVREYYSLNPKKEEY